MTNVVPKYQRIYNKIYHYPNGTLKNQYNYSQGKLEGDSKIYYDGVRATSISGTIAGSTTLLDKIVKKLISQKLFKPQYIENVYKYHGITPKGEITWSEDGNILSIKG